MGCEDCLAVAAADQEGDDGACQVLNKGNARCCWSILGALFGKRKVSGPIGISGLSSIIAFDHIHVGARGDRRLLHRSSLGEAVSHF